MEKFILVQYLLQGRDGKILVADGKTEQEIKEFCVINSKKQEIENLSKEVKIKKE